ncbi:hypothetical protein [Variovorax sp. PAMC 28711]|uniref:hypothetical protein n=1 Tax=Variovorax sp. PAMC 28711 TaxID=1795631 RepID=UPI00078CE96A|nr:hypothetical protein [Variovorax sp. PAMC 28711]AMM23202.1 hypothetical protein AX767_01530 [Variovorax sp. PAMC 28711]
MSQQPTDAQIEAAAKIIAECMDYPWAHMPEQGRKTMREHASKVAAVLSLHPAPSAAEPGAPKPYAYAIIIPDERRVELVHDLDEAVDELTNCACEVLPLYDHPAPSTAQGLDDAVKPAIFGDEDHVLVPRGLLGAACSAIDKKRDGTKVLAELRRYTTGDLSAANKGETK